MPNALCSGVYCITAIGCCVCCTHISWVEHNSCLSTHSNNKLSLRHKQEESLSQLTLQGKCRSVEYHYWNCNKSGTPGLIKLFLYKCYVIISNHKFSCQCVLPLSWGGGRAQFIVGLHYLVHFQFICHITAFFNPLSVFHAYAAWTSAFFSCLLSNRITALLEMTYIWLVLQHLILSSKS